MFENEIRLAIDTNRFNDDPTKCPENLKQADEVYDRVIKAIELEFFDAGVTMKEYEKLAANSKESSWKQMFTKEYEKAKIRKEAFDEIRTLMMTFRNFMRNGVDAGQNNDRLETLVSMIGHMGDIDGASLFRLVFKWYRSAYLSLELPESCNLPNDLSWNPKTAEASEE